VLRAQKCIRAAQPEHQFKTISSAMAHAQVAFVRFAGECHPLSARAKLDFCPWVEAQHSAARCAAPSLCECSTHQDH
jgi:hypothetical protein